MWVPTSRSRMRKVEAIITAGMANMITNEVTSIDQTNSGMLVQRHAGRALLQHCDDGCHRNRK